MDDYTMEQYGFITAISNQFESWPETSISLVCVRLFCEYVQWHIKGGSRGLFPEGQRTIFAFLKRGNTHNNSESFYNSSPIFLILHSKTCRVRY